MPKNISEFIANRKKAIDELTFKISPEGINKLIQDTNAEIIKHNEFIQNAASLKFGGLSEWVEVDNVNCFEYKATLSVLHKHSNILAYQSNVSISVCKYPEQKYHKGKFYSFLFVDNIFLRYDIQRPNHFTKKQATREKVLAYAEKQLKEFFI